ncbi:MAG TPA: glycosyltransferase [Anaerohalosphaeraceae bacterium]|nr:glycosyltransferase [Anaerohalosphaeraceae bacterium]
MKILMLNYEFPPIGGGGGYAHQCLLKEYSRHPELQIDVLTSSPAIGLTIETFSDNIRLYRVGIHKANLHFWKKSEVLEWLFKAERQLNKLLSSNNYDLAHAFFGFPTGWLTCRRRKILPYLISLRGSDVPGANPRLTLEYKLLGPVFRKIWRNASLLAVNSKGLARRAKAFLPDLDYPVIPNGVDTERFRPASDKPALSPFKLITVGRLTEVKRLDLALEAVCKALSAGLDVELTIVGDGNLTTRLKQLADALEISRRIHFTGWLDPDTLPEIYPVHHCFLLTSLNEGMNNALLEALASGLAVITTPCEGTDELVQNNGIVVEHAGPQNLADAIIKIAQDSAAYSQMCKTSRTIAERFSWSSAAELYIRYYHQLAASGDKQCAE